MRDNETGIFWIDDIIREMEEATGKNWESSSSSYDEVNLNTISNKEIVFSFNRCITWASENHITSQQDTKSRNGSEKATNDYKVFLRTAKFILFFK